MKRSTTNNYNVDVRTVPARARSKRLRETGVSYAGGGSVVTSPGDLPAHTHDINEVNQLKTELERRLLKETFDALFRYDQTLDCLFVTKPIAVQGGVTMFADAGTLDLPSIYDGIPLGDGLEWRNGQIVVTVNGGLDEAALGDYLTTHKYATQTWVTSQLSSLHTHSNKSVLDTITSGKVAAWDSKESALGNPATSGYLLSSTTAGVRSWVKPYELTKDEVVRVLKDADGCIRLDASMLLSGGLTMLSDLGFDVPSIFDNAPIATPTSKGMLDNSILGTGLSWEGGKLTATATAGTFDHTALSNRNAADQHTIAAITGLQSALDGKSPIHSHPYLSISEAQSSYWHNRNSGTSEFDWRARRMYINPDVGSGYRGVIFSDTTSFGLNSFLGDENTPANYGQLRIYKDRITFAPNSWSVQDGHTVWHSGNLNNSYTDLWCSNLVGHGVVKLNTDAGIFDYRNDWNGFLIRHQYRNGVDVTEIGTVGGNTVTRNPIISVQSDGKVGIGQLTDIAMLLDVNGTIRARSYSCVYNPKGVVGDGTYIELAKYAGGLPGYPNSYYPTLRTDFQSLYFSCGGKYTGWIHHSDDNNIAEFGLNAKGKTAVRLSSTQDSFTCVYGGGFGVGTIVPQAKCDIVGTSWLRKGARFDYVYIECDTNLDPFGRGAEINCYTTTFHLQYNTAHNMTLCYGGGSVVVGSSAAPTGGYKLDVVGNELVRGNILAHGGITMLSDMRLKNRISNAKSVLPSISNIDVFRYTLKADVAKRIYIGVSAQQIQGIWSEFVHGVETLSLDYAQMAAYVAIKGLQETKLWMDAKDKKIYELEKRIVELEKNVA